MSSRIYAATGSTSMGLAGLVAGANGIDADVVEQLRPIVSEECLAKIQSEAQFIARCPLPPAEPEDVSEYIRRLNGEHDSESNVT